MRGRIGFAADRVLLYGTGGLAMGEYQVTRTQIDRHVEWCDRRNCTRHNRGSAGPAARGIEFALSENWTAKVEYLYADLENGELHFACGTTRNVSSAD